MEFLKAPYLGPLFLNEIKNLSNCNLIFICYFSGENLLNSRKNKFVYGSAVKKNRNGILPLIRIHNLCNVQQGNMGTVHVSGDKPCCRA